MAGAVALACLGLAGLPALTSAQAAAPAPGITFDAPVDPRAGTVELSGSVGAEPGQTTSVLYVMDATRSTRGGAGSDCSGVGGVGADDDLNGDGSVGDVLDCEIAGVLALNRSLATTSNVQAGLVAFSNSAAAADLDPAGSATFLAPAATGGDSRPRLETVATSVTQSRIGLYDEKDLSAAGASTAFTNAVNEALARLAGAPAGPKWIMFMSDGQSGIDDAALASLASSGVRLRTFGIGPGATCAQTGSLYKMASATGEACTITANPANLAAGLTGSQPDTVNGVTVTIGSVAVAATIDAVGGWRAAFTMGAGTYTATARATLASGAVRTAQRTFTVAAGQGVAAGTVTAGPGSLLASAIRVATPQPTRSVLPARVTGKLGRPVNGFSSAPALARSRVLLQARTTSGDAWTTVATDRADKRGRFDLRWKPRGGSQLLRVALRPPVGWAESFSAVPQPAISACKVDRKGDRWSLTCRTTAKKGAVVRLLDGRRVLDRTKARQGTFKVHGQGRLKGKRVEIAGTSKVRLAL